MKIVATEIETAGALDFDRLEKLGFDALLLHGFRLFEHSPSGLAVLATTARAARLRLLVDVEIDGFSLDHPLVSELPGAFSLRRAMPDGRPVDPRAAGPPVGQARARLRNRETAQRIAPVLVDRLCDVAAAGVGGLRVLRPDAADPELQAELLSALRKAAGDIVVIAQTPGLARERATSLQAFDCVVSSFSYWDGQSSWLAEEYEALRRVAPVLSEVTGEAMTRNRSPDRAERLITLAAAAGQGLIVPAAAIELLDGGLSRALALSDELARFDGEMRLIPMGRVAALLRSDTADVRKAAQAALILTNRAATQAAVPREHDILAAVGTSFGEFRRLDGDIAPFAPLAECEVRPLVAIRAKPIATRRHGGVRAAREAAAWPRFVIDSIAPNVEGGRFPAKRTVGDIVTVEANVFGDGHEQLAAELRWRARDEKSWRSARMRELGNDRWRAEMPLERLGRHEFVIEGWLDVYGGFRRDLAKKLAAGVAEKVEYLEGRRFIEAASGSARPRLKRRLEGFLERLDQAADEREAADLLLDPELALLMDEADSRPFSIVSEPRLVDAERLAARFSSWYELFPRSQTDDPKRHGTFEDVIRRMPAIRSMGFDTLYFTPIHPIGRKHRKGRNNTLTPAKEDPGSPYAIGADEGGHNAIHPELGTLDDFRRMVAAAHDHGLEIALDFAVQCAPDHPWLKEHPGWFDWRPDGTLKYAENPPKKYQDIVNVDFYKEESIPGLWVALRDVVLFWVEQGVKTFRVDNPHTKPLPFWQWMIDDIRAVHPDVIFLSEAFTRPAMMYRLAKVGFSQSYTYFTWRNGKRELTEYLTELTATGVADFFRPHFFVNTPDINPTFLHASGRAGFKIRAALAATLSGLFGLYSGFELCEAEPVPGKEEYWESEKYEIKPRDWQQPGNIIEDITRLNHLRRAWPALQTHLGLSFYNAWNDQILYYGKRPPSGDEMILVAVSLDPHNPQEARFEVPLWEWAIPDDGAVAVEDLVTGQRFEWHGKMQHMRLDPDQPYAVWHIAPPGAHNA